MMNNVLRSNQKDVIYITQMMLYSISCVCLSICYGLDYMKEDNSCVIDFLAIEDCDGVQLRLECNSSPLYSILCYQQFCFEAAIISSFFGLVLIILIYILRQKDQEIYVQENKSLIHGLQLVIMMFGGLVAFMFPTMALGYKTDQQQFYLAPMILQYASCCIYSFLIKLEKRLKELNMHQ